MLIRNLVLIGGGSTDVPAGGTPVVDPFFSTVVLLLNPTGADGSTTLTDRISSSNMSVIGNGQIDTGVTDGGNSTVLFDGNGDAFRFSDDPNWNLAGGSFWLEARVRFNSTTGQQFILSQWQASPNLSWVLSKDGSGNLAWNYSTNGSSNTAVTGTWSPSTGTFYDVAVSYDGNKIRLFVNGSMVGSSTVGSITLFDSSLNLTLGSNSSVNNFYLNGWIGRLRLNKGSDRGIGDGGYTPQSAGHFPTQ